MFAISLTAEWMAWVAALAAPLHRRSAWRLAAVVAGILWAQGRRTASSWWRAAGIGMRFRSYYDFLDSVGRKTTAVAAVVFGLLRGRLDVPGERLLLALDERFDDFAKRVRSRLLRSSVFISSGVPRISEFAMPWKPFLLFTLRDFAILLPERFS